MSMYMWLKAPIIFSTHSCSKTPKNTMRAVQFHRVTIKYDGAIFPELKQPNTFRFY